MTDIFCRLTSHFARRRIRVFTSIFISGCCKIYKKLGTTKTEQKTNNRNKTCVYEEHLLAG